MPGLLQRGIPFQQVWKAAGAKPNTEERRLPGRMIRNGCPSFREVPVA